MLVLLSFQSWIDQGLRAFCGCRWQAGSSSGSLLPAIWTPASLATTTPVKQRGFGRRPQRRWSFTENFLCLQSQRLQGVHADNVLQVESERNDRCKNEWLNDSIIG
jgi:hypothetical protein